MPCEVENCGCYADVDVYFSDDSYAAMCSKHAWKATEDKTNPVVQGVPRHGGDDVNRRIQ